MPSAIGPSGNASAAVIIGLTAQQPQGVLAPVAMESANLAKRLGSEAAASPSDGRGQIVDSFA